jgi:uncharacterized protein YndB with AHSA1/START domain
MNPIPTGRLVPTADGLDLVLNRRIKGSIDDVWASVTESERTARWFARWEGAAGPGAAIRVQMTHEERAPWTDATIQSCDPPHQLAVSVSDAGGGWLLEIRLAGDGEHTDLTFLQHRLDAAGAGDIGPGWEYYLDMLIASRDSRPLPSFDDYHPSMSAHFTDQAAALT